jgi:hypothetical protein
MSNSFNVRRRQVMDAAQDKRFDKALDSISVAPPEPDEGSEPPKVRDAHDATDHQALADDPADEESKLDVGLDESFPSSDPPAAVQPGHADPAPSSGYNEEAERAREKADPKR